jgi:DNA-binding protein WhiA
VRVTYADADVAEAAQGLIAPLCNRQMETETERRGGHRYTHLTFVSKAVERVWFRTPLSVETLDFRCEECAAHFLRGVFMAAGTMNDPEKSFHLELRFSNFERARMIGEILTELGMPPGVVNRNDHAGLYYKKVNVIQDFLTCIGATQAVFATLNQQIERDIRNNENRATNCVARNISRSVSANARQLEAIRGLAERGLLPALPEDLQETAKLRLTYPDATLSELASRHSGSITKSGLNHRLEKIMAMFEQTQLSD